MSCAIVHTRSEDFFSGMMVIMMTITNTIICLDLLAIGIGLPESDAVLLGHVPALGQHLHVGDHLPALVSTIIKIVRLFKIISSVVVFRQRSSERNPR